MYPRSRARPQSGSEPQQYRRIRWNPAGRTRCDRFEHRVWRPLFRDGERRYSRSTNPTFGHYTGEHKAIELNWLQQTEVTATGTYTLSPFESTSGTRALRILRDPVAGSWLWAEYRQPLGVVDTTLSNRAGNVFSGILLHYENPELDLLHTYLLNYEGTSNANDAVLTPGGTWSDPYSPLTLTANSANSITASYGPHVRESDAQRQLRYREPHRRPAHGPLRRHPPGSTLRGRQSGTGNGTVNFAESANTGTGVASRFHHD